MHWRKRFMKNMPKNEREQELAWDNRELGLDEKYVKKVSLEKAKEIDAALGLQSISIRLQTELIEQLKILAIDEGLGYQPFIRHILTRYVKDKSLKKVG